MDQAQTHQAGFRADIIADSINTASGQRCTTFVLTFPRIILAEVNTHRALSRNSASSRAIPFKTMVERCKCHPFVPLKFQRDHKGMQGSDYFEGKEHHDRRRDWLSARNKAVGAAEALHATGVTKQLCNRLLEQFMWHTAIVTATDWENFFALRAHGAAEIHFQRLANMMLDAMNRRRPQNVEPGCWHIPFGDKMDVGRIEKAIEKFNGDNGIPDSDVITGVDQAKLMIATARCARVSYNNFDGKDDYLADFKLFTRLASQGHMSPFEHVAQAHELPNFRGGNFRGWRQLRKMMPDENRPDSRLEKRAVF